jgi:hypothetical protein
MNFSKGKEDLMLLINDQFKGCDHGMQRFHERSLWHSSFCCGFLGIMKITIRQSVFGRKYL